MMSKSGLSRLPEPPYYAVIFTSRRSDGDDAYAAAAQPMAELAQQQPGFQGVESTRGDHGCGITVSYWADEPSIVAWKRRAEHAATRARGSEHWYHHYELRVAKVERAYGKNTHA